MTRSVSAKPLTKTTRWPVPEPSTTRAMTLRLDVRDALILQSMARANSRTVTAEIRDAIDTYIAKRKADPEFQRKLDARIRELEALRA